MDLFLQHPATGRLFYQQGRARFARILHGFRTPRRALLSLLAVVLAVVWISQALVGVCLRDAADPERLHRWLTVGLTGFAMWNLIKTMYRKPVEPFEWSAAEQEWLCAAPLSRGNLIRYRLGCVSAAAMVKSGISVSVMLPDLHFAALGFVGFYLGLMMIEVLRLAMEIFVDGLTPKQRALGKLVVGGALLATLLVAVNWYAGQWRAERFVHVVSLASWQCIQEGLQRIPHTTVGGLLCWPCDNLVARLIFADQMGWSVWARLSGAAALLWAMVHGLNWLDTWMRWTQQVRDRRNWKTLISAAARQPDSDRPGPARKRRRPSGGAMGALVWRQGNGCRYYRGPVLYALVLPMLCSLAPAWGPQTGWALVQAVILLLGFSSFFLLPTALKFDFRRDLDRISVLKALPLRPGQVVVAQLVVPVLVTSLFQLVTLVVAMLIKPFAPGLLLAAMALLLPFNLFVFALENLIFLLYPYRVTEESIRVFLRTILAFTAKGVVLGVVVAMGLLLQQGSAVLGQALSVSAPQLASLVIFAVTSFVLGLAGSSLVMAILARIFRNLDPSQDLSTATG